MINDAFTIKIKYTPDESVHLPASQAVKIMLMIHHAGITAMIPAILVIVFAVNNVFQITQNFQTSRAVSWVVPLPASLMTARSSIISSYFNY